MLGYVPICRLPIHPQAEGVSTSNSGEWSVHPLQTWRFKCRTTEAVKAGCASKSQ